MIRGPRGIQNVGGGDIVIFIKTRQLLNASQGSHSNHGWHQYGRHVRANTHGANVAQGKGRRGAEIFQVNVACGSRRFESFHFLLDFHQTQVLDVANDRYHQAVWRVHGNTNLKELVYEQNVLSLKERKTLKTTFSR